MKTEIGSVEPSKVLERVASGAILIDVRESAYFEKAHLPGAINLSVNTIAKKITLAVQDKGQEVICYCNGGTRGPRAAQVLVDQGYTKVNVLQGGLRAYMSQFENE